MKFLSFQKLQIIQVDTYIMHRDNLFPKILKTKPWKDQIHII